jgi:beta-lactamase class A
MLRILLAAVLAAAGFLGGYVFRGSPFAKRGVEEERVSTPFGRLTSPYLECPGVVGSDPRFARVRFAVRDYIRVARRADPTLRISFYARDLNNGPWIGVDEREPAFVPASLWKVPLMVYILAMADADRQLLAREVVFPGRDRMRIADNMTGEPETSRLQAGESYSYEELLRRMIVYSDNYARELLTNDVTKQDVDRMLAGIGAEEVQVGGQTFATAKAYASIFRVLYNGTWLSRPLSEFALGLLAQSEFRQGLRKHLPGDVEVASKFGLHVSDEPGSKETQFHECGIVYGEQPYIICVMTKSAAATPDRLAGLVADISKIVWQGRTAE